MPQALIANNAATTLSTAITTTGQLSMVVVDASKFPVPSGGDYFYCTLLDASNIPEIVKVTVVAGTTLKVTLMPGYRGREAEAQNILKKAMDLKYVELNLYQHPVGEVLPLK